jgi:hypothetical protein
MAALIFCCPKSTQLNLQQRFQDDEDCLCPPCSFRIGFGLCSLTDWWVYELICSWCQVCRLRGSDGVVWGWSSVGCGGGEWFASRQLLPLPPRKTTERTAITDLPGCLHSTSDASNIFFWGILISLLIAAIITQAPSLRLP